MNKKAFFIFFSIVIAIYSLINFYIYKHGLWAIPVESGLRNYYTSIFIILSGSYIIGRFLERFHLFTIAKIFIVFGSFWLAAMTYFFFMVLNIYIIRDIKKK